MAGRDITEGRASRSIAVDIGLNTGTVWQNTTVDYDMAIGGIPFLYAINDQRPYERSTAQFRKQQFDSQRDPGEQSLSNWWIRSQSSFHAGEGIKFYDPFANPFSVTLASNSYRIAESYGVDIWTQGQVSLLHDTSLGHITTTAIPSNGRVPQEMQSITWTSSGTTYNGVLMLDGYDIDKIDADGNETHFHTYSSATGGNKAFAMCNDGTTAYWITNDSTSGKLLLSKKSLNNSTSDPAITVLSSPSITVTNAAMEYVKERIVMAVNNSVYEVPISASGLPTALYTHPNTSFIYTSVAASGPAIYIAGFNGLKSTISKFVLNTDGTMPTLTSATVTAELPVGEVVHKMYYYLGYLLIGTSKGVRVAEVSSDGTLTYGPIIKYNNQPCYSFAARENFVWCAMGVGDEPGVVRIDLSTQIEPLRFAYANDIHYDLYTSGITTTACAFAGDTNRLQFASAAKNSTNVTNKALTSNVATLTVASHPFVVGDVVWVDIADATFNGQQTITATSSTSISYAVTHANVASTSATGTIVTPGNVYVEATSKLRTSGYFDTGFIRYNTLEEKNFKRVVGRGDFTYGSMSLQSRTLDGTTYDIISYDSVTGNPEVTLTQPSGAQDALGLRFVLYHDAVDDTKGPVFKGYQFKSVPATPRNRMLTLPLQCLDTETDRYNVTLGYEGRAFDRLSALEAVESLGDVTTFQDFRTNETYQCLIEEIKFVATTPPDKRFNNFGGIILLTIRTV